MVPDPLPGRFQREIPASLGVGERGLGALLAVDVDDLQDDVERVARVVAAQQGGRSQRPDGGPIPVPQPPFGAMLLGLAPEQAVEVEHGGRVAVWMNEVAQPAAQQSLGLDAEHLGERAVRIEKPTIDTYQNHPDRGAFQDPAQQ